jgi:3-phenylpropionate/trans-cinnamate dioxygenase ferredoxin subunit
MTNWHDVGSLADLERDGRVVARVGGREVGVVLDPKSGSLYGLRNRCPHHGGPLCLGTVEPRLTGRPGSYAFAETAVIRCPWHGWEFDPGSGVCLDDPALRVAVYAAKAAEGRVLVDL